MHWSRTSTGCRRPHLRRLWVSMLLLLLLAADRRVSEGGVMENGFIDDNVTWREGGWLGCSPHSLTSLCPKSSFSFLFFFLFRGRRLFRRFLYWYMFSSPYSLFFCLLLLLWFPPAPTLSLQCVQNLVFFSRFSFQGPASLPAFSLLMYVFFSFFIVILLSPPPLVVVCDHWGLSKDGEWEWVV